MSKMFGVWLWKKIANWLSQITIDEFLSPNDMNCVMREIRAGDVLLVEGRTRIGNVIKIITRSSWSHAAICIGRLEEIKDEKTRALILQHYDGDTSVPLIIEAELNKGTVVEPVTFYLYHHVRICRPAGLLKEDADKIVAYVASYLGSHYDVQQLFDLARFLIPWWVVIPHRWHSTLFEHNAGIPTRTVCSTMIASAFRHVDFPILPLIERCPDGGFRMRRRNPKIFTPRDFDYSPFFRTIKCPLLIDMHHGYYRKLPWNDEQKMHDKISDYLDSADVIHVKSATDPNDEKFGRQDHSADTVQSDEKPIR